MSREAQNTAFAQTSFLHGVNGAYVEEMQALYEQNPGAVSEEWRLFFQSLQDEKSGAAPVDADGPSWARPLNEVNSTGNPDLLAALTGDYGGAERVIQAKIQQRAAAANSDLSARSERPRIRSAPSC
jgi:2-oxoglutarate dehydrogenase E1 component